MRHRATRCITIALTGCAMLSCAPRRDLEALQQKVESLESTRREVQAEVRELKTVLSRITSQREALSAAHREMGTELVQTLADTKAVEAAFLMYRAAYRESIQARARGMHIADFWTDNRLYQNVKIQQLTDHAVSFVHKDGSSKLPLSKLPEDLQQLFAYQVAEVAAPPIGGPTHLQRSLALAIEESLAAAPATVAGAKKTTSMTPMAKVPLRSATNRTAPWSSLGGPVRAGTNWWKGRSGFTGSSWHPLQ